MLENTWHQIGAGASGHQGKTAVARPGESSFSRGTVNYGHCRRDTSLMAGSGPQSSSTCCLCLAPDNDTFHFDCGHAFHGECLQQWAQSYGRRQIMAECPSCLRHDRGEVASSPSIVKARGPRATKIISSRMLPTCLPRHPKPGSSILFVDVDGVLNKRVSSCHIPWKVP